MAGEVAGEFTGDNTPELLCLVHDIAGMCAGGGGGGDSSSVTVDVMFRKDCTDLVRRISLLTYLFEEIRELNKVNCSGSSSSGTVSDSEDSWSSDLVVVLQSAKRLLSEAKNFSSNGSSDEAAKTIIFQFQCVTWKLEKLLSSLPYDDLDISEEVKEQVDLVRTQLRRATDKYGFMISKMPSDDLSKPLAQEINQVFGKSLSGLHKQNSCPENLSELGSIPKSNEGKSCSAPGAGSRLERTRSIHASYEVSLSNITAPESQEISGSKNLPEVKKPEAIVIPEDFLCPISLELMRDPVIVAEPGDCVVAVHVVKTKSSDDVLKIKSIIDGYLEVYEGLCDVKKVGLSAKILTGRSIRNILVREAKDHGALALVVGGKSATAKYCAKQLPLTINVLAVQDSRIVFGRCNNKLPRGIFILDPRPSIDYPSDRIIQSEKH